MTSVLNVDTIADKAGTGPVALTKQQAAKSWASYDAVANSVLGSFNQSSLTDVATGEHAFTFTNAFSSATDRAAFTSVFNSINGSAKDAGADRAGPAACIGGMENFRALSASEVYVSSAYQARAESDGAARDYKAIYCTVIGDLA